MGGSGRGEQRTENMSPMFVTREVSQLSGWLKAVASYLAVHWTTRSGPLTSAKPPLCKFGRLRAPLEDPPVPDHDHLGLKGASAKRGTACSGVDPHAL